MRTGYQDEVYEIIVDTPTKITGLTDVEFSVYTAAGVVVTGSPFAATEILSSGVYRSAGWTPDAAGDFIIEVSSASQGIAEVSGSVRIEEKSVTDVSNEIAGLNNIAAADVWAVASRTLTDKSDFELTTAEHTAIADAVQAAIINEGDGQQVVDAIVSAIGNTNLDQAMVVAAIRADLERTGGLLDVMDGKLDTIDGKIDTLQAGVDVFRILN